MIAASLLWVPFTLLAAAGQTARNAMQRELTAALRTAGPTHVRFLFGVPFALLFLPFAVLPLALSMLLWNALNAGALWWSLGLVLPRRGALVARAIVFLDMLGSLQNVQSNALVTALIIVTFIGYERRHTVLGALAAREHEQLTQFALKRDAAAAQKVLATHIQDCVEDTLARGVLT